MRSCANDASSSSPSSMDRIVAPVRRASATRSSSCSGASSGATTNTVSSRRAASSRANVTERCGGACGGGSHRTSVGDSSGMPASRDSSSRCAARCHGSSVGVPTRSRPPGWWVDRRRVAANALVRSTHPVLASSSRSTCTRSASTCTACRCRRPPGGTDARVSGRCAPRRGSRAAHVVGERRRRVGEHGAQVGVPLDEPRQRCRRAGPAMSCQTSTWASQSGPAPMPIVGIAQLLGDPLGDVGGHHLQDDRERAGLLERAGRRSTSVVARVAAALHPVAAEGVLALRGEADVRHHRDARSAISARPAARRAAPPSSLTACAPPSFMKRDGRVERLLGRGLVGAERQVGRRPARAGRCGSPRAPAAAARRR